MPIVDEPARMSSTLGKFRGRGLTARVRWRKLLRAAHAEPMSRRPRSVGAAGGTRSGRRANYRSPEIQDRARLDPRRFTRYYDAMSSASFRYRPLRVAHVDRADALLVLLHRFTLLFDDANHRRRQHAAEGFLVGVNGELLSALGFGHDRVIVVRARQETTLQASGLRPRAPAE